MPKVSYMKAVDYFLLSSFAFIFAALIEFIVVLNTNPEWPAWCKRKGKKLLEDKKEIAMECEVSDTEDLSDVDARKLRVSWKKQAQ